MKFLERLGYAALRGILSEADKLVKETENRIKKNIPNEVKWPFCKTCEQYHDPNDRNWDVIHACVENQTPFTDS